MTTATQSAIFEWVAPQIVAWLYLILSTQGPNAVADLIEDSAWCRN